jgi:multiple sugar transport system substrate-binding protein
VIVFLLLPLAACGGDEGGTPVITYYTPPDNSGLYQKTVDRCNEQAGGDYKIELAILPAAADGQREQLVRRLAAEDPDIDVMSMDVIWTAEFAEAGWALPWPEDLTREIKSETIPSVLSTAEYEGELYGAPLNTNTQLLWYRKDKVPGGTPPATWEEMIQIADGLPEGENYIEVQASRYEGLTVWFNSLLESAGGSMLSGDGESAEVSLPEEPTRAALEVMRNVARSSAADPNLPNSLEDEGRLAFQDGRAAFMVNYPFVYDAIEEARPEIFDQLGVAPYPSVVEGEPAKVTLGGYNLGVWKGRVKAKREFK